MDFSLCPSAARVDRTLGDSSLICSDGEPLGRVVIGLFGKQVPKTVSNFVALCSGAAGASYEGTIIHRILAGQYLQGGRQGSKERGEVDGDLKLEPNPETINSKSFKLTHTRPGTVSLALSTNDDEEDRKLSPNYRNVEFLITTGPGPAPQLDNGNIVIGTVLEARKAASSVDVNSTMDCLGEVYYIIEDLSETASGKAACGKAFVSRLSRLAMGGDDAHLSTKVRRALLDCLCALISLSPNNQSLLLQEPGCLDLFNRQLAECGDFTMQGTLAEILFRLSWRAPQLTAQLSNSQVVKFLKSVHGKKQHDLVAEIRQLVNIVNKANAPYRSVHSFVLKSLRIGGADVTSRDERWIDFGYGGLSDEILAIQPTDTVVDRIVQEVIGLRYQSTASLKMFM
eukprot:SM000180S03508  [mRNA]  locus=s180:172310:176671:+ [translate_table: standard]